MKMREFSSSAGVPANKNSFVRHRGRPSARKSDAAAHKKWTAPAQKNAGIRRRFRGSDAAEQRQGSDLGGGAVIAANKVEIDAQLPAVGRSAQAEAAEDIAGVGIGTDEIVGVVDGAQAAGA